MHQVEGDLGGGVNISANLVRLDFQGVANS